VWHVSQPLRDLVGSLQEGDIRLKTYEEATRSMTPTDRQVITYTDTPYISTIPVLQNSLQQHGLPDWPNISAAAEHACSGFKQPPSV